MSSLSVVGTTREGVPVVTLKAGSTQTRGKAALMNNIGAAKLVASMLRSVHSQTVNSAPASCIT
ncbi:MAG TPA: hypothetical protein VJP79_07055 [Nitrososphaera sp.]|jgi:hypothetical protein|nr:hypothetical protein [Nitrososphaera sp.]